MTLGDGDVDVTVSVVTPVFNGADHVLDTIRHVQRQTFAAYEHIVVDDGSTDGTGDVVRQAAADDVWIRLVQQANQGLSVARNVGLRHADPAATFVLFLDHDDLMRPDSLRLLVDAARADGTALAVHGALAAVDGGGAAVDLVRHEAAVRRTLVDPRRFWSRRTDVRELDPAEPSDLAALGYVLFIYTVGQVLIRRSTLDRLGGFDPLLRVAQDLDMWLRIAAVAPLGFVPDVVLDYRQTAGSLSSDQTTTRREDLYVRFKAMTDPSHPPAVRTLVRDVHRHHEWHRAADRWDLLRAAARDADGRGAAREAVRSARSVGEALLAAVPWSWPYRLRMRRFRHAVGRRP